MSKELIQAYVFTAPVVCLLVCLGLLLLDHTTMQLTREEKRLRRFLSLAFGIVVLLWVGLVFKEVFHRVFAYYFTVFLFSMMVNQVLIYRFVFTITAISEHDRFGRFHYVLPVLLTVASAVTDLTVAVQHKEAVIYGDSGGTTWFAVLYVLTGCVALFYYSFYPAIGFLRVRRYRRHIGDYSADVQRTSLNWLVVMQLLTLIIIPVPFAGLLLNMGDLVNLFFVIPGVLLAFCVYPVLCFNLLSDNYVIMTSDDNNQPNDDNADKLDPKRFTHYLRTHKPYLNPQLRITHVAADLCTNRNYLSFFINREYGMSFSRLINSYRLKELHRLRISHDHRARSNAEIVLMSGFSCYRSYLRAKKMEDKAAILKEN